MVHIESLQPVGHQTHAIAMPINTMASHSRPQPPQLLPPRSRPCPAVSSSSALPTADTPSKTARSLPAH